MKSMTGFGKAETKSRLGKVTVEISSVNNRFLEISARIGRQFFSYEARLRELISAQLNRGKVYLYVGFEPLENAEGKYALNMNAARAYYRQLVKMQKDLGLAGEIEIADLLVLPELVSAEKPDLADDKIWPIVKKTAEQALTQLTGMRKKEGAALSKDMRQRLKLIESGTRDITSRSAGYVDAYRERLTERVRDLIGNANVNTVRLEEEILLVAERTDISEECTRLKSHISQFRQNLNVNVPVGKKLNFILQEMNREANTIASKCSDVGVSNSSMTLKEEVERLREQLQNVE